MAVIKRIVVDVLKPHEPNPVEFASQLADLGDGYEVNLVVQEMDDKTQSTLICITGDRIEFDEVSRCITAMGGSLHSIDEVDVYGETRLPD